MQVFEQKSNKKCKMAEQKLNNKCEVVVDSLQLPGREGRGGEGWGGLRFNRAPALPRHSACVFRVPRPKPRLPEKVGTPLRKAARVVRGGARPPPLAHRR
jgi:hypothetical protein